MPEPLFWEKPRASPSLLGELRAAGVKPRLTFVFPTSGARKAMRVLQNDSPEPKAVKDLLGSKRVTDVLVGLNALDKLSPKGKKIAATLPILRGLLKHENEVVRKQAVVRLAMRPETTVEYLRYLSKQEDWAVHKQAFVELDKRLGATVDESHGLFGQDVHDKANSELTRRLGKRWLLGSQKPVFATAFTKELVVRFKRLEEVAAQLKKEFGRDFVGVTVVGSTTKGYATPKSDLDYALIASNKAVLARFKELAKDLNLCVEHYVGPASPKNQRFLFYGLFFGDRELLEQHQAEVVNNISEWNWNSIRNEIAKQELELFNASIFGLTNAEAERLALAVRLLRVPPELSEMKNILRRRLKQNTT